MRTLVLMLTAALAAGCGGAIIEPGHRGLFFDAHSGGLRHEVLGPGFYKLGTTARVDDFDVTYSTRQEELHVVAAEGLAMDLHVAVIFRPIVSELYELDTEIGPNYYDEVIGPEFRSAARGVLARHSYAELSKQNEKVEDEIEVDLRRRVAGKHVEVTSVTLEGVTYAPEIAEAVRARLVGEQESARQKAQLEADALKRKLELEHLAETNRIKAENALREKENEHKLAEEQAAIDLLRAETEATTKVTHAKADAEAATLLARAHLKEALAITPLQVQMHAYDALAQLGGGGTHVLLGDWSKVPSFLFPHGAAAAPAAVPAGAPPTRPSAP